MFGTEQAIHDENPGILHYRIPHLNLGNGDNLVHVLEQVATNDKAEVPITVVFSNLGPPKRTWHSHCLLTYSVSSKQMAIREPNFGEVNKEKSICARCVPNGR